MILNRYKSSAGVYKRIEIMENTKYAPCLDRAQMEQLARILGEEVTGSKLPLLLEQVYLHDTPELSTKWKRIFNAFAEYQNEKQCSNQIMRFIKLIIEPANYLGRLEKYQQLLLEISKVLSFVGYEVREDGKIYPCMQAKNLSDAEKRANNLLSKLRQRDGHPAVFYYCRAELLDNNYFHAVFEANKGLFQRLRDLSGLTEDGNILIEQVFSKTPILIINSFQSQSEQDEHKGFSNLLKGIWGMFRNPEAHEAKITWNITEQDALDILCLISYCHRRLDNAQRLR